MRVPQVTERMKEAPAHALRAVFAGIGQVLLVADRIRNRPADGDGAPPAATPAAETTATQAPPAAPAPGTTSAQAAPAATAPASSSAQAAPAAAGSSGQPAPAATAPDTTSAQAAPAAAGSSGQPAPAATVPGTTSPQAARAPGDLPVPGYDELSVASLRARMRSLGPAQLRALVDYESAHAARPAVLAMFERRIAKVEGGEA